MNDEKKLIILIKGGLALGLLIFAYIDTTNRMEILKGSIGLASSIVLDVKNSKKKKKEIEEKKES